MNFQQILFPVDLSDRAHAASKYVRAMADSFHSKLTLIHAVEDPVHWYGEPVPIQAVETDLPQALKESAQALRKFAGVEFPGEDVALLSEPGDPADLIERTSEALKADLIMMPSRGRGRFRAALLGSITAKVLHDLTVPVWTEAHQEALPGDQHFPVRSVLCAIDLGPESEAVLRFASDFAIHFNASLCVAHGIPVTELSLGAYKAIQPPEYMEDFAREEIQKLQSEAGTSAEVFLEGAPIAEVVCRAAAHHHADLVVIGRGHISHPAGRLNAHTLSIIRKSPCPVLSL